MAQAEVGKMDKIRVFLEDLVSKGELDLSKPVPNARLREWARQLKEKYGEDFNVHTVGVVLRELRIADTFRRVDQELAEASKAESVADVSSMSSSPESDAPNAPGSGSGGDVLPAVALVGGLAAALAAVIAVWYYLGQNK